MRSIIKKKKAQVVQFLPYLLIGVVFVIGVTIFAIVMTHTGDELFDALKSNEMINSSNNSVQKINQVQVFMTQATDQLIFFLLGAILLGFVALAIFSDFHPILIGVMVLFTILMVVLSGVLTNVIEEVESTDVLTNKSAEFVMTNNILGANLPILIAVFGAIAVIILLAKRGKVTAPV